MWTGRKGTFRSHTSALSRSEAKETQSTLTRPAAEAIPTGPRNIVCERRVPYLVSAGNLNPTGLASINSTACFILIARTRPGFSRA